MSEEGERQPRAGAPRGQRTTFLPFCFQVTEVSFTPASAVSGIYWKDPGIPQNLSKSPRVEWEEGLGHRRA